MSVRSAEDAGSVGAEMAERRGGGGPRVHFEALVAVGEAAGGGFEAESVDVSLDGMRLRTAYLPEVGDKLVCRFDGMGAEVVAEGEVIWRNQEARGGEFGLRFIGLDAEGEATVRAMCASLGGSGGGGGDAVPAAPDVTRGARVRLHIEGLGSPMKARVREAGAKEIEVGSNLEFLKVGRSLELEDVEQGKRREARIENVKVDVDATTHVPQLVVTLRFDALAAAAPRAPAASLTEPPAQPAKRPSARSSSAPATRRTPESSPVERHDEGEKASAADGEAGEQEGASEAQEGVGERAARASRAVAGKLAPAFAGMSSRARGAMTGIVSAIQKKRADRAEAEQDNAPRRMTAPPPGGALKTEGRRLVREDDAEAADDETAAPPAPRMNRRAAAFGSALGLAAVLVLFGVSRFQSARSTAGAVAGTDASLAATAVPSALPAAGELPSAAAASGTPVANVPLFGATPLSTIEPVPPPPAPPASAGALAGSLPSLGGDSDSAGEGDDEEPGMADKSGPGVKEWGQGTVAHPVVLKIKMDGPIERINGAAGAMGFTLSIPDRRSLSSSSDLARKDKRLASVNVINTSHGAEVTVQFKDGVPSYRAKAKGDRLEIALGTEGHKKIAKKKKGDDKAKPKASKKKPHK